MKIRHRTLAGKIYTARNKHTSKSRYRTFTRQSLELLAYIHNLIESISQLYSLLLVFSAQLFQNTVISNVPTTHWVWFKPTTVRGNQTPSLGPCRCLLGCILAVGYTSRWKRLNLNQSESVLLSSQEICDCELRVSGEMCIRQLSFKY